MQQPVFPYPLIFVRHGVTDWNIADRYQGSTDTHLNAEGRDQARANANAIETLIRTGRLQGDELSIASSPLTRANASAEIIAEHLAIPQGRQSAVPQLRELSMGRWEGLNNLKVKEVFYEERKSRKQDRWNFKPEGGDSLAERAPGVVETLTNLSPNTVVVTHAGILRIILHILGGQDEEQAAAAAIPHEGLLYWDGVRLSPLFPDSG